MPPEDQWPALTEDLSEDNVYCQVKSHGGLYMTKARRDLITDLQQKLMPPYPNVREPMKPYKIISLVGHNHPTIPTAIMNAAHFGEGSVPLRAAKAVWIAAVNVSATELIATLRVS